MKLNSRYEGSSGERHFGAGYKDDSNDFVTDLRESTPLEVMNGDAHVPRRTRNHSKSKYSASPLTNILSHALVSEKTLLREMEFEKTVYEGRTNIF